MCTLTIFLDEVAELPLTTQARLLRVLESGEFIKVGSSQVQRTNIRVVAATNVDMARAVADGRFREDLYYRLSTVQISIPPLRERGSDILLLARKFASDFAERYRMPAISFGDSARALLQRYRWPGNVRQLKNVVEQAALFEAGTELGAESMSRYLPAGSSVLSPALASSDKHSYEREREMLLGMIMRLQSDIRDLGHAYGAVHRVVECRTVEFIAYLACRHSHAQRGGHKQRAHYRGYCSIPGHTLLFCGKVCVRLSRVRRRRPCGVRDCARGR